MNCRALSFVTIIGIVLLTAGCWIPESFEANVTVNKDGSYKFTYDGTLTFALALAAAKDGSLSRKDEADLKREAEKMRREPGFKDVKYLGKGRYKVFVEKSGKPGEPYYFVSREMKMFVVQPQKDGALNIHAVLPSKKDIDQLKSVGAKIDGSLTVSVAKDVKVIKHNAQSEPKVFGLFGGYKWGIKSLDVNPFIVVKPSP